MKLIMKEIAEELKSKYNEEELMKTFGMYSTNTMLRMVLMELQEIKTLLNERKQ